MYTSNDTPTLVLIPGLVSDRIVWDAVAEAAGDRFAVHHADLSQGSDIAAWAAGLLQRLEGPLIVAGHSMGGRVAMEMAHQAPDRVIGLVLANTGHGPRRDGEEAKRQEMIDLGHSGIDALAERWLPPMLAPGNRDDAALVERLTQMVRRAGPDQHERQIRALLGRPNATAYLGELTCPILLITGSEDGWSPVAQHQDIANAVPDARLVVIDEAGHFAPVERPDPVTRAISEWLDQTFGDRDAR